MGRFKPKPIEPSSRPQRSTSFFNPMLEPQSGLSKVEDDMLKLGWGRSWVKAANYLHTACGAGAARCTNSWALVVSPCILPRDLNHGKGPAEDFVVLTDGSDEVSGDENGERSAGGGEDAPRSQRRAKLVASNPLDMGTDASPETVGRVSSWIHAWASGVSTIVGRVTLKQISCLNVPLVRLPVHDRSLHALSSGSNVGKVMMIPNPQPTLKPQPSNPNPNQGDACATGVSTQPRQEGDGLQEVGQRAVSVSPRPKFILFVCLCLSDLHVPRCLLGDAVGSWGVWT
jgi:hypothetical protein